MLQPFKKYLEYMPMTIQGVLVDYTFFPIRLPPMRTYTFANCWTSTKHSPILTNVHWSFANSGVTLTLFRETYIDYIHTVLRQMVKVHNLGPSIPQSDLIRSGRSPIGILSNPVENNRIPGNRITLGSIVLKFDRILPLESDSRVKLAPSIVI
jgi:hypothetical protein